jgi:DNA topoisomerase I
VRSPVRRTRPADFDKSVSGRRVLDQPSGGITEHMASAATDLVPELGLRYTTDEAPGIRRVRSGRGFTYRNPDGSVVRDPRVLERIRSIVIPPAWTNVWICTTPNGHLQATGRDARGRKQYRYHPRFREVRDATKFDRMLLFGETLPAMRGRIAEDLSLRGLQRDRILAAVVALIDRTLIRVGNDEYARANASFGAATLRGDHVTVHGDRILLQFTGKSGKQHEVELGDRRLANIIRRLQELPAQELFAYIDDDGVVRDVGSGDVNDYVRAIGGDGFTVKDFRTWGGSVLAFAMLREAGVPQSESEARRIVAASLRLVAAELGNTAAVARAAYVHPAIIEAYTAGDLRGGVARLPGLSLDERRLLGFLRRPEVRRRAA